MAFLHIQFTVSVLDFGERVKQRKMFLNFVNFNDYYIINIWMRIQSALFDQGLYMHLASEIHSECIIFISSIRTRGG